MEEKTWILETNEELKNFCCDASHGWSTAEWTALQPLTEHTWRNRQLGRVQPDRWLCSPHIFATGLVTAVATVVVIGGVLATAVISATNDMWNAPLRALGENG